MPEIESAEKRQGLHLACFTRTVVESKRNSPAPTVKTAFKCESRANRTLLPERSAGCRQHTGLHDQLTTIDFHNKDS